MATLTTKLDAVNAILSRAGRQPVSSLTGPLTPASAAAVNLIDEMNRDIQNRGWDFNHVRNVVLTRDGDLKIPVPPDAIEVDLNYGNSALLDVEVREGFLYDRQEQTFVFTVPTVTADITYLFDFEKLPEQFRQLVQNAAALAFVEDFIKDQRTIDAAARRLSKSWADAKAKDTRQGDYSTFHSSPAYLAVLRRRPGFGRTRIW